MHDAAVKVQLPQLQKTTMSPSRHKKAPTNAQRPSDFCFLGLACKAREPQTSRNEIRRDACELEGTFKNKETTSVRLADAAERTPNFAAAAPTEDFEDTH